ncbi:transposase [Paenibacillus larvae]|nr:transposase [Paenibacillus larvae]MDT2264488.1 transposase [Paenibacillus larvae]
MLFEDESMIRDHRRFRRPGSFMGSGIIPTTGKHRGVKLLATVDYETGHIVWQEDEQYTAETFLSFFKGHGDLSNRKLALVLDNAGFIMQSCFGRF